MPPAERKPRPRSYDPARTRAALAAQTEVLRGAVHSLCTAADADALLARPTRLGEWRVRELVAHLGYVLDWVPKNLGADIPRGAEQLSLTGWVLGARSAATVIDQGVRAYAADAFGGSPQQVAAEFDRAADLLLRTLAEEHAPGLALPTRYGPILLSDYLVTRLLETVVHGDDLADALGTGIPPDRQALAATTRLLADSLAAAAPGGSVELRIPPFAVVQCVEGPRHTRGTPPNVVETAPLPWIRLATGRASWAELLDVAQLTASGERSDLSSLLPVMG
ncbi:maleylpyruvate isomerase family mycothiol-dependent enzyme [Streptacidiphilus carbonis]|uniref:maleylpyruvate isomerase family mycothiol-dependent enzyme n=1 Tax=Streptacidiphilus carbonis TaxID=105422 RepID=UPI0005A8DA9F|nr:maleylpyruvate isomerase family mycothiol-dependent enzyme [Streptacidiphilus carbonis]